MEEKNLTGYPSIDKPWLKYYSKEAVKAPIPKCTIYEYLYQNNKDYLNDIALQYFGTKISYKKLFSNIEQTTRALSVTGIKPGDVVAVCMPSTPEAVYLIYALNFLGAVPNLLDPRYSESGLAFCLSEAPASLLITFDGCYKKFTNISNDICPEKIVQVSALVSAPWYLRTLDSIKAKAPRLAKSTHMGWKQFLHLGNNHTIRTVSHCSDNCAAIIHTGGTTGNPKGVMLSDKAINAIAHQYKMLVQPKRGETLLDIIPPFASYGLCASIHMPLTLGLTIELCPKFNADQFGRLLHKIKPTYVMGVPSFWESILSDPCLKKEDMAYLLSAACGGDSMSVPTEKKINHFLAEHHSKAQVDSGYGMSEMSATACVCYGKAHTSGSVGIPLVNTTFKIVDPETGEECSYDQRGEICISGPGMMLGYLNNEELTENTIRQHSDGLKWVHTGDIGHINKDGFVFHDGRIKRLIVRYDGFKIYPAAVEQVILKSSAVQSCAVIGISKPNLGVVAKAYMVLNDAESASGSLLDEIIANCRFELAERAVPEEFDVIDSLPLTSIGKVDYLALEKKAVRDYE